MDELERRKSKRAAEAAKRAALVVFLIRERCKTYGIFSPQSIADPITGITSQSDGTCIVCVRLFYILHTYGHPPCRFSYDVNRHTRFSLLWSL